MDDEVELRHLRYFVAVAEELHFGRAARRLHLSQPPLSQQIRRLEILLGYPLFVRTSRSVSLTVAGEALLERARRTLQTMQSDIEETRSVGRGELGSLHIGFVGSGMLATLPAIFREFREAYPGIRLHLHESFTARVAEGLESGRLDVGVLRDADSMKGMEVRTIYREPFVAVLPATHPYAGHGSVSPAVLRDEPFVYYPRSAGRRAFEKPISICEEFGFQPHIVQEASHWMTILRLIGAGLGVSIAPECVRRIASEEVVCLPITGSLVTSEIELAYRKGEARPIVERFVRMAEQAR